MNDTSIKQKEFVRTVQGRQQVPPPVFPYPDKVPPPIWPEAPADSGYKPGMTAKEYWEHLCKTEAGEFIYKTVENVDGIYQMRPREHVTDKMLQDRYFLEDPYGEYGYGEEFRMGPEALKIGTIQSAFVNPASGTYIRGKSEQGYVLYEPNKNYKFLEKPLRVDPRSQSDDAKYLRYTRPNTDDLIREHGQYFYPRKAQPKLVEERVRELQSRYGFTWRGIERSPRDRELGIAGSELIILDLHTNEILAVRRGFIRSGDVRDSPTGIWWLNAQACPSHPVGATHDLLLRVLKPTATVK